MYKRTSFRKNEERLFMLLPQLIIVAWTSALAIICCVVILISNYTLAQQKVILVLEIMCSVLSLIGILKFGMSYAYISDKYKGNIFIDKGLRLSKQLYSLDNVWYSPYSECKYSDCISDLIFLADRCDFNTDKILEMQNIMMGNTVTDKTVRNLIGSKVKYLMYLYRCGQNSDLARVAKTGCSI